MRCLPPAFFTLVNIPCPKPSSFWRNTVSKCAYKNESHDRSAGQRGVKAGQGFGFCQGHEFQEIVQSLLGFPAVVERAHRGAFAGIEVPLATDYEKAVVAKWNTTGFSRAVEVHQHVRVLVGSI